MATHPLNDLVPFATGDRRIDVLVVDDDEQFAAMTARFLDAELPDARTTTVTDPRTAVGTLRDGAFDCIVSDFEMPSLSGLELLERVRDAGMEIPFVLFTAAGSEEVASRAISRGVDEYVQKGGRESCLVLANAVEQLVAKHWAEQEARRGYLALDSIDEGIGIVDAEGILRYVNEAYASMHGYDRDALVGEHWEQLYPDDEIDRFHGEVLPELSVAGSWRGVSTGLASDGERLPQRLVLTRMPDGGHVCVSQETDRRDRIEAVFELTPDIVVIHDAEGRIVDANRQACAKLGYDREELLGMTVWDLDVNADPDRARDFWRELPIDTPRRFEGRLERADGSTFPVEIHLIRLEIAGEERFVAIDRDITERKAREEELVRKNERLEEFSSVVSHDLRNPLQVAQGRIELLAEDVDSEHVPDIQRALDRMETLIDDLLTIARQGEDAMAFEPVDVAAVATEAWGTVETGAASLTVDVEGRIEADRDQLRQLFENLFRNAMEHGSTGDQPQSGDAGEHGSTGDQSDDAAGRGAPDVTVGTLPDGFYVADDGPGIPTDERGSVFDPGYSTSSEGSGLGLNIVSSVADAHGWDVSVTESDAGGARFEITGVENG
ncbi:MULTISPECIES: PAS domain S-box protein [Halolamina]|uniref:histidine kinase n=1 Tax=Halolamina pelagica TaxID=699431 RepID=A0A1I5Q1H0_9EURY|nr:MULTISPECIES: PAS domain S-box protein [Halolamina]NHX35054.1 PAS domain S-box protein [Halolamina sp. R1-12]SFP40073.1 PAS domain S-box-containing protein [Halolamina pelagica]